MQILEGRLGDESGKYVDYLEKFLDYCGIANNKGSLCLSFLEINFLSYWVEHVR